MHVLFSVRPKGREIIRFVKDRSKQTNLVDSVVIQLDVRRDQCRCRWIPASPILVEDINKNICIEALTEASWLQFCFS